MPMPNSNRVLVTTTQEYLREVEVNVLRERKLLAMLQAKGRITTGHSGEKMNWKVRHKRAALQTFTDGQTIAFARQDRHKEATLDYRAYVLAEGVSEFEQLQNRGDEAIVNFHSNLIGEMTDDLTEGFGDQLYVDGNATGSLDKLHGIESFLGANLSAVAGTGFAQPSDTYAGLSTALGFYGGNWSAAFASANSWPDGKGDPHYDFWSPVLVNYTDATSGVWAAATKTWPNTCVEALRRGIDCARKQKSSKGDMSMIVMETKLFSQFKQAYEARGNIQIHRNEQNGPVALGFTDMINFEGTPLSHEFGMPVDTAYGFNVNHMELCSMQDQLFVPDGPHWNEDARSHRTAIMFYGNARFNPRNQAKWYPYGANA